MFVSVAGVSLLLCLSKEEKKLLIHNHVINDGQQRRKNLYTLTLNPHSRLLNEGFPLFLNAFFDLQGNFSVYVMIMLSFVSWQDDLSAESDDDDEEVS